MRYMTRAEPVLLTNLLSPEGDKEALYSPADPLPETPLLPLLSVCIEPTALLLPPFCITIG